MNARVKLFFRIKLYLFFGLFFLSLILGAAAVRWLPLLHFQTIVAFDERGRSTDATALLLPLFRDGLVRVMGEDSVLLWLASTVRLYPLVLSGTAIAIDWRGRQMTFRPTPQTRALIWCVSEDCVWVSDRGVALEGAPASDGQLVRRVVAFRDRVPSSGALVLSEDALRALLHVFDFLERGGVSVARATFDALSADLTVVTDSELTLLFNLRFDLTTTMRSFADVAKSIPVARTQSVDFRVPQKIYYVERKT